MKRRQTAAAATASWRRTGLNQKCQTRCRARAEPVVDFADETAASVIEVAGVIKWFDVAKGYGFIVPDNGMADVLLHVTVPAPRRLPDRL